MAVVIGINKEGRKYDSANKGLISDAEQEQADKLNDLIQRRVADFLKGSDLNDIKKNRIHF